VLVCAAGKPDELAWYAEVAVALRQVDRALAVRLVAAERPPLCPEEIWVRHWPAIELLPAARAVVGGAGYNTVAECLACGVPLVARPWPRTYDRQEFRARNASARGCVKLVREPAEAVHAALDLARLPPPRPAPFPNGAATAVDRIASLARLSAPFDTIAAVRRSQGGRE